jgi:hypothetical protein
MLIATQAAAMQLIIYVWALVRQVRTSSQKAGFQLRSLMVQSTAKLEREPIVVIQHRHFKMSVNLKPEPALTWGATVFRSEHARAVRHGTLHLLSDKPNHLMV